MQDTELLVDEGEIFASDETAVHPLDSIIGKCDILTPAQAYGKRSHKESLPPDSFVCSRKYIPEEGRVVPLDNGLGGETLVEALQDKPFAVVDGRLVPIKRKQQPNGSAAAGRMTSAAGLLALGGDKTPPPSKRRRHATPTHVATVSATTSHEETSSGGAGLTPRARAARETHGRWAKERYENAKTSLVYILGQLGATSSDKAILRPSLREEARKVIGDTGLLDHLLKHLADKVVTLEGDKLRRRHNREGHMEYWLQSPAAAEQEEAMLREEMAALSSELREVKEARHILRSVRTEAAQAIQAVSGIKEHPDDVARKLAVTTTEAPEDMSVRLDSVEMRISQLYKELRDAEGLAVTGMEDIRRESGSAGRLAGEHVGSLTAVSSALAKRCEALERQVASVMEEGAARYEALSAGLTQVATEVRDLAERVGRQRNVHAEVDNLKHGMTALITGLPQLLAQAYGAAGGGGTSLKPPSTAVATAPPASTAAMSPTTHPQKSQPETPPTAEANKPPRHPNQPTGVRNQLPTIHGLPTDPILEPSTEIDMMHAGNEIVAKNRQASPQ